jgi:hypothetical protein
MSALAAIAILQNQIIPNTPRTQADGLGCLRNICHPAKKIRENPVKFTNAKGICGDRSAPDDLGTIDRWQR